MGLIRLGHDAGKPIFRLTTADRVLGSHSVAARETRADSEALIEFDERGRGRRRPIGWAGDAHAPSISRFDTFLAPTPHEWDQPMLLALGLAFALARPSLDLQDPPQPICTSGYLQVLPFPLTTRQRLGQLDAECYTPGPTERAGVEQLRNYRCLLLQGLNLPGNGTVDLELTRIDDVAPKQLAIKSNFVPATGTHTEVLGTPTDMSLWSGTIAGITGSRVCLGFSAYGTWGWVQTNAKLFQVASFPNGSWAAHKVLVVDDEDKGLLGPWQCGNPIPEPSTLPPSFGSCLAGLRPAQWSSACSDPDINQLRLCRAAIETDWQYFSRFRDLRAAEVYARFVFGAVAQALRLDVRVVCRLDYLGIWINAADPWTKSDIVQGQTSGPCCVDVFYEFQHRWGTEDLGSVAPRFDLGPGLDLAPVDADLYHFMGGVQMGCAVGSRGIGTVNNGFSISTGMGAVNFANPNEPRESPYFQVYGAGHEIGHSFGVGHTHDFLVQGKPIDDCAVDPGGGRVNCGTTGFMRSTLMSYCIGCPGQLRNVRIDYHPEVARCMRNATAKLPDFEDVQFVTDLGFGWAPGGAPPTLRYVGESSGIDTLSLAATNLPSAPFGAVLLAGLNANYLAVPPLTIVPAIDAVISVMDPAKPLNIPLPDGFPHGLMLYFQEFVVGRDFGYYLSNAIALEVIR
jgi:hypothetical protein